MTIPELRAMLEILTDEDFRAALPLERCNQDYVRLMEDRRLLRDALKELRDAEDLGSLARLAAARRAADELLEKL